MSLIEIKTDPHVLQVTEPLFSLDGVVYEIPAVIPGEVSVEMLHRINTEGEMAAIAWTMEKILGADAWKALRTAEGIHPRDLAAVMEAVREKTMGVLEEEGKS